MDPADGTIKEAWSQVGRSGSYRIVLWFMWLQNFFTECVGKCSADFIPVQWYGSFEILASHIGQVREVYPNMTIWMTEYAYDNVSL